MKRRIIPKLIEKYGDVKESVLPDVPVQPSFEDFKNGVDTVFQKIVEDIKK